MCARWLGVHASLAAFPSRCAASPSPPPTLTVPPCPSSLLLTPPPPPPPLPPPSPPPNSMSISVTSSCIMSARHPSSSPTLGRVRPKSPCTNSLMYVPACAHGLGYKVLGFGVWGLGFRVYGLGCRVWGLGLRVCSLGCRVWGSGFGAYTLGFGAWVCRFRIWGIAFRVYKLGSRTQDFNNKLDGSEFEVWVPACVRSLRWKKCGAPGTGAAAMESTVRARVPGERRCSTRTGVACHDAGPGIRV